MTLLGLIKRINFEGDKFKCSLTIYKSGCWLSCGLNWNNKKRMARGSVILKRNAEKRISFQKLWFLFGRHTQLAQFLQILSQNVPPICCLITSLIRFFFGSLHRMSGNEHPIRFTKNTKQSGGRNHGERNRPRGKCEKENISLK